MKSRVLSSLFWKFAERAGNQLIQLVIQIVLARLLVPAEFGMLAIMIVFVNIGNVIAQSGLNTALVQAPVADDDDFSTVFWMSFCVSLVLYILIFFAAPAIAHFYNMDTLVWPLRALCLILLINSYNSVQIAHVQRNLRYKKTFISTIVSVVCSGTVGVAVAFMGGGVWALVVQQIIYQATTCLVLAIQVPWKPRFVFRRNRAKSLFGFGWKLLVSSLLETVYLSLSDLIIGKQFSASELGYVNQAKRYPSALSNMLNGAIQPVIASSVARIQDDVGQVKRLVRRALKTSTCVVFPSMVLFALVAEPLVVLLLGDQWLPSVFFLQVYCFTFALYPIHTTNLHALNGMGRSDMVLKLELIKKGYGLFFLLVTAFYFQNIYLLVSSYLIAGMLSTFVNAFPNKKIIGYSYSEQVKDIAPMILLSLVSAGVAWPLCLLQMSDILLILTQTAVMVICYTSLARLFHIEAYEYLWATVLEYGRGFKHRKRYHR